jgi:hypothetical protein
MKIFFSFLITSSIVLILFSCTKLVYISSTVDPEIILEKEHHNVAFVNLFDYTLPVNVNRKNIKSYHAGVMNLLDGLSSFSSDSSFSFTIADSLKKSAEAGLLTTLLPADTINSVCNRLNANLLLALDSMSVFFDRDTVANYYYGGIYRTINFYLNTNFFFSLYSAEGDLIDRNEVDEASIYRPRTSSSGLVILIPSVARSIEDIENLAFQAGQDYVSKFYSQIIHDTKQLYTGRLFKESNDLIFAKNWNKATELLEQLTKNQDPVIAKKASHNLEIAEEASHAGGRK